jgi:hypothetical protein
MVGGFAGSVLGVIFGLDSSSDGLEGGELIIKVVKLLVYYPCSFFMYG